MSREVNVRFAPSPTGYFHVGGARTALYNWVFKLQSEKSGFPSRFILRIEDTDQERNRLEWIEGIINALSWLKIKWDEPIVFQSERLSHYREAREYLINNDLAYYCDCTRDEIVKRVPPNRGYDGYCRNRELSYSPGRALRFKVDVNQIVFKDLIRGSITIASENIEDFILFKGNGDPLFILANTLDDLELRITHVIRGEEHLPNTPKGILLAKALSKMPHLAGLVNPNEMVYAHLPILVNEKRQKLSKRRDKVALEDYREMGILPEAMVNYLALLGWGPKNGDEILDISRLVEEFRLQDVNHSPALFDDKKLLAINGHYIRSLPVEDFENILVATILKYFPQADESKIKVVRMYLSEPIKERIRSLSEIRQMVFFFFEDFEYDAESLEKIKAQENIENILTDLIQDLNLLDKEEFEPEIIHEKFSVFASENGLKLSKFQLPVRVALTGLPVGPPLFEIIAVLGKETTIFRLKKFLDSLKS